MRFGWRIVGGFSIALAACGAFDRYDAASPGTTESPPEGGAADGANALIDGSVEGGTSGQADAGSAFDAGDAAPPGQPNASCFHDGGGPATITTNPTSPIANSPFDVRVVDTPAYTNVEVTFCTPLTNQPPKLQVVAVTASNPHTWTFTTATGLPAGITQVVFRADPGEKAYGAAEIVVR